METDLHLLSRYHRHGDADAFRNLVESHAGMVHSTASRVTRDTMLAQDVAQETFLALAHSSGAAIQSVGAWLHHVAWQKARDVVRGESRRRNNEAAAAEQLHEPQADATWADMEAVLDEAIEELPQQLRSMLIARYFEGHTQQEIAKHHQINQSSVSRALEQGIAELRSNLKARGVLCGVGLAALLTANGVQAAPPAVMTTLGKLALTGVGSATASLTSTQSIIAMLMTPTAKLALAAVAALTTAVLADDLASSNSTIRKLFSDSASNSTGIQTRAAANNVRTTTLTTTTRPTVNSNANNPASSTEVVTAKIKGPSPVILTKLLQVTKEADFKTFIIRVHALRDPALMAVEIERVLGLRLTAGELAGRVFNPSVLEVAIFGNMALKQPEEMLAWMSMYEGSTRMMSSAALSLVLKNHPHITAESIAATLPAGPNRDAILSLLRAQRDPVTEAISVIDTVGDERARLDRLWQLAQLWPKEKLAEGARWALQNLEGQELHATLPRLAQQLSVNSPDAAVALLGWITEPDLLTKTLVDSMHGLVQQQPRMADVVQVIDRLQGQHRAYAIAELGRRWVRVDQSGLMQWINNLESPADFEAALPLTLPQLSSENYTIALNTLMQQLDGTLDVALIKTAMPQLSNSSRTSTDIIRRFTALPQYREIGSGHSGNQALLWEAVKQNAEGWVTAQGADPTEGAKWIDSLPFRTPADKAFIVGKLAKQWALSNPTAAAQWAAVAGVTMR